MASCPVSRAHSSSRQASSARGSSASGRQSRASTSPVSAAVGTLPTQIAPNWWSVKYPSDPAWWYSRT